MVKPERNKREFGVDIENFLEEHISLIKPLKGEDEKKVYFKDLRSLATDTDSLKDIYYFLQDTHCSDWIQRSQPNNFNFELFLDSAVTIRHDSYKNYYMIWFSSGKITKYSDEDDNLGSTGRFEHTIFMYLAKKGYLLPMYCWWNDSYSNLSQYNLSPTSILSYFSNVELIS